MQQTKNKMRMREKREKLFIFLYFLFITSEQYTDIPRIGNKAGYIPDKRNKAIHVFFFPVNINAMFRLYCSLLRL